MKTGSLLARLYSRLRNRRWPILRVLSGKDPITWTFVWRFFVVGLFVKIFIINGVGVLFFDWQPLPILRWLGLV